MSRLLRILVLLAVFAALPGAGSAMAQGERIRDFFSYIEVGADGTLTVSEVITVDATGEEIKRGIYRDFPTIYEKPGGGRHTVGFEVLGVQRDGKQIAWFAQNRSNGVRVYLGSKDILIEPGTYTYKFTYRTDRQIFFDDERDELYWNVTGNDWVFPIDSVAVFITLPGGARVLSRDGYTGRQGAKGKDWSTGGESGGRVTFKTTRTLAPGEGFTISITWPKGFVAEPGGADKARYLLRDNMVYFVAGGGLFFLFLFYYIAWSRVGRDPEKGTIIPLFDPPKGLSPAAARYVLRMGFDSKAIGAAVISLAVKGYLTITETGGKEYLLERQPGASDSLLSRGERAFSRALFAWGDRAKVEKGRHERLKPAVDSLKESLAGEFKGVSFRRNAGYFGFGILVTILVIVATIAFSGTMSELDTFILVGGTVVVALILNILFGWLLKAPTLSGRRIMDHIEGFKQYLSVAEGERMNLMNPPDRTPELFEKYLPYALALDVENEWSEGFAGVLAAAAADPNSGYRPHWYHGHHGHHWSSPAAFASDIGGSLGGAISSAATPPGSSSGSGGGGSSGGGGGGGGGGGF